MKLINANIPLFALLLACCAGNAPQQASAPAPMVAPSVSEAAPTFSAAQNKLTAEQVQTLYATTHHESGYTVHGNPWQLMYTPDGTIQLSAGNFSDVGHGVVRGDTICSTYSKLWNGQEHCFHYAKVGNGYASYEADGSLSSVFTVWNT